jgi:hypothetical protein
MSPRGAVSKKDANYFIPEIWNSWQFSVRCHGKKLQQTTANSHCIPNKILPAVRGLPFLGKVRGQPRFRENARRQMAGHALPELAKNQPVFLILRKQITAYEKYFFF